MPPVTKNARVVPGGASGRQHAHLERPHALELGERRHDLLERGDPVAQARSVLEALLAGGTLPAGPQRRQGAEAGSSAS